MQHLKTIINMKKILLLLAASAFIFSCNNLADNEYEVTGIADASLNGKNIILEKQGGYMGYIPVDTVKVEDGKFMFKDTISAPGLYFISVDGKPGEKANFILEPGKIKLEVNKDTIYKTIQSGTYNNEKLHEYYGKLEVMNKKRGDFVKVNQTSMEKAQMEQDTVTMNRLNKQYKAITMEMEEVNTTFIKENPKAYISVLMVKQLAGSGAMPIAKVQELYDGLDAEIKKTKEGKEAAEMLNSKKEEEEKMAAVEANVQVGKMAPDFSAPSPEGKTISLKESLGKVTIIDFWASWCKPCRLENPNVVAMYNELHGKGLNIIGVSLDKDAAKWKEAIAQDKLTWNHISNLKFWEEPIAQTYGVRSIPATFILDATGKIVAKDLRGAELKAKVEELLAK